jgi:O-antigen ligase
MTLRRETLVQILILVSLFLSIGWKAMPNPPAPFSATYVLGFYSTFAMLITIGVWGVSGMPNVQRLWNSTPRLAWFSILALFVGWAYLSQFWAFVRETRPAIAQNATMTLAIMAAFCVVVVCCPPKPRWLIGVLAASLLLNSLIGGAQVAQQGTVGLNALGELRSLNPAQSGVSVVQSGEVRLLRPYGLLPHPNIFAGVLLLGLAGVLPLLLNDERRWRLLALALFALGVWMLWLSFSRGAWVAAASMMAVCALFVLRTPRRKYLIVPILVTVGISLVFVGNYRPFLSARVGINDENTEQRSIADRVVYTNIALDAIGKAPVQGIGVGNFAWYSARYLRDETDFDLQGGNVHQVALMLISELGLVGFALFGGLLTLAIALNIQALWRHPDQLYRLTWLGAVVAFAMVGLVDQYPITLPQAMTWWFVMMALGSTEVRVPSSE